MTFLARRLRRAGHRPSLFGYVVLFEDLDSIAQRFSEHAARALASDVAAGDASPGAPYAVVGHSLGSIVARAASPELPDGFAGLVMVGPPNRPPATARLLERNPLFRVLARDAGSRLTDPGFFAALPRPEVPTLVIAGTGGPRAPWLPCGDAPNDGIVRVDEARLEDAPLVLVDAMHTFLMNRRPAVEAILQFIGAAQRRPPQRRSCQ